MHTTPAATASTIGHYQQRTTPRLASTASPSRLLSSTPNKPIVLLEDEEADKCSGDLSQIPLTAHSGEFFGSSACCSAAISSDATESDKGTPAAMRTLSPVDLDGKISAMLAATASLNSMSLSTTPQLSRSISRTLSNIGRQPGEALQVLRKAKARKIVKGATPEFAKRNLSPGKTAVEYSKAESTLIPDQLTTIELRLNEGNNLNRGKVQKIVGGSKRRKPVNCQSQLVLPSIVDDYRESNGQIDSRPGTSDYACTYPRDLFGEETSFEENLSDGMLSECPTGSSTPRTIASTVRLHRIDENDDDLPVYSKSELEPAHAENLGSNLHTMAPYVGANAIESTHVHGRVKKHPSPSKKALEDLEVAFAIYARLKPLDADDTDELAKDGLAALLVSDHNKAIRREATSSMVKPRDHVSRSGAYRIRRSLLFRASLTENQDFDELGR